MLFIQLYPNVYFSWNNGLSILYYYKICTFSFFYIYGTLYGIMSIEVYRIGKLTLWLMIRVYFLFVIEMITANWGIVIATENYCCEFIHIIKAVRFWSCPLSQSRGRIIPHRPFMPKWAQIWGKILTQVAIKPTTSR